MRLRLPFYAIRPKYDLMFASVAVILLTASDDLGDAFLEFRLHAHCQEKKLIYQN